MPWHVVARLPDGTQVMADHRDPIVPMLRRLRDKHPAPTTIAAVQAWADTHRDQITACFDGTCGHD